MDSITESVDLITEGSVAPHHFPRDMLGFTAASSFIIAIIGTVGNLMTIIALPLSKKLRTTATAFVINLAVVELMFCVLILPASGAQYAYLRLHTESLLTDKECTIFAVVRYTLTQAEVQTILAIALTRAIAVGSPKLYKKIDNKWITGIYIGIIWVYSFVIRVPTMLSIFGSYKFNAKTMECDMANDPVSLFARFISVILEAIIPVLLIIFLYIFIFIMVKLSSMRVARGRHKVPKPSASSETRPSVTEEPSAETPSGRKLSAPYQHLKKMISESSLKVRLPSKSSSRSNNRDMRVARTIFIIFMIVIICSVPVGVIHAIDSQVTQPRRFLAVHILYWLQYCLNVVVYVLMNRQYRIAYVELLSRLLPSCQRHASFSFPWENPSVSSRPLHSQHNSIKTGKSSSSQQSAVVTTEYKPVNCIVHHHSERLPVILEVNSSSCISSDDVFVGSSSEKLTKSNGKEIHFNEKQSDGALSDITVVKYDEAKDDEEQPV